MSGDIRLSPRAAAGTLGRGWRRRHGLSQPLAQGLGATGAGKLAVGWQGHSAGHGHGRAVSACRGICSTALSCQGLDGAPQTLLGPRLAAQQGAGGAEATAESGALVLGTQQPLALSPGQQHRRANVGPAGREAPGSSRGSASLSAAAAAAAVRVLWSRLRVLEAPGEAPEPSAAGMEAGALVAAAAGPWGHFGRAGRAGSAGSAWAPSGRSCRPDTIPSERPEAARLAGSGSAQSRASGRIAAFHGLGQLWEKNLSRVFLWKANSSGPSLNWFRKTFRWRKVEKKVFLWGKEFISRKIKPYVT